MVCGSEDVEDVSHFLLDCKALASSRARMWDRILTWYTDEDTNNVDAVRSLPPTFKVTFLLGGNVGLPMHHAVDRIVLTGVLTMAAERKTILAGSLRW